VGTPFTIDLHTQSYRFQKEHRIMVQVQSPGSRSSTGTRRAVTAGALSSSARDA
jgi:hypothetical protein